MNLQTFRQNLITNTVLLLLFCVCLLFAPFIFNWNLDWADWLFMVPIILVVIAGGAIVGFISKNKIFAVVLGFLIPVCSSIFFFWQMRAFIYFLIPGVLCAIASGLMASENKNKYVRYVQYLAATLLLMFTIYLIDMILYLLYTS